LIDKKKLTENLNNKKYRFCLDLHRWIWVTIALKIFLASYLCNFGAGKILLVGIQCHLTKNIAICDNKLKEVPTILYDYYCSLKVAFQEGMEMTLKDHDCLMNNHK
jgi:hypothetical protein